MPTFHIDAVVLFKAGSQPSPPAFIAVKAEGASPPLNYIVGNLEGANHLSMAFTKSVRVIVSVRACVPVNVNVRFLPIQLHIFKDN
jgi:hypothetical protein